MSAFDKLKAEITQLRDEAKVQAHLGSMEARQEWEEMETKWHHFISQAGLHESGEDIKSAFEALGQELRAAYQRLKKAL